MSKWIFAMLIVKLLLLLSVFYVFSIIGGIQGVLYSAELTPALLRHALTGMGLIAIGRYIGNFIDGELAYRCSADLRIELRRKIFDKMLELEVGYTESAGTSDAVTAGVDGIEALETYFSKYLPALAYCFTAPFILFFIVNRHSPQAAIILFAASIVVLPVNQLFRKIVRLLRGEYWDKYKGLSKFYLDSLEGLNTFILFGADQKRRNELSEQTWGFRNATMKVLSINFNSVIVSETIIYLTIAIAITFIAESFGSGQIPFGRAIFLLMMADTFFAPVKSLMSTGHTAMNGVAAAENVYALLNIEHSRRDLAFRPEESAGGEEGFVLTDVHFGYGDSRQILSGIDMKAERGKTTAIVGQSGCGKSTIANLLMRFYDANSGAVRLDGRDVRTMAPEEIRRKVSIVPQSTYIFTGSIADNLKIARKDATDEEMLAALDMVKLGSFVRSDSDGLNMNVGEAGVKLSGGQKQKLGIARAILADSEIYIFDEATSSVDAGSENDIWECIGRLSAHNTLVIISHRLSTIRKADTIYVMRDGRIEESGTHAQLISNQKLYYELVTEQNALESYNKGVPVSV
jgi:ATP-binding cassette subfamily C protein